MTQLKQSREAAYLRQHGRCFYCEQAMPHAWDIETFATRYRLSQKQARQLICTAEHLHARCNGGGNASGNIVAACWLCNQRRHKRPHPLEPEPYKRLVMDRIAKGSWHHPKVLTRLLAPSCQ